MLTSVVCAVTAGARSFVAIAEWVGDLPAEVSAALGVDQLLFGRCAAPGRVGKLVVAGRVDTA